VKIVVCMKRVPDTESRIRIGDDGTSIDASGIKHIISPYDEYALETALRLKDASGGEVLVCTVGDAAASEQLRAALAMGADAALLLKGAPTFDGLATAKAIAAEVRELGADLVLTGMKAVDDDQQQVGPMLGELLGWACVTAAASIETEGNEVVMHREVEGGVEVVATSTPCVVTVTKGEYEARYPSLKGIMAAKKKPLEEKDAQLPQSRVTIRSLSLPPERPAGRIVGEGVDAVPELVRVLREEAKVL
jgi:electron transfer flavoprotein beta subunit